MRIHYPATQIVSVWVGSFLTEKDFNQSVDLDVTRQLGLSIPIESICEISFEQHQMNLRKLLEGFSGWETFVDHAATAAHNQGIDTANAALVCYYLKCEECPLKWGALRFLGSFKGQDVK